MKNKYPKVSLIISTYNRPKALNLCLQSVIRQSILPDEVIIGDDGSKEETRDLIRSFQENFPVPLIHVWQEDEGFRVAKSRNRAIAASQYEYIIEVDGDVILHRDCIADHLYFSKGGYFLKGGRVNLTETLTNQCCEERKLPRIYFFSKGVLRRINALRCLPLSRYFAPRYRKGGVTGLGCNMSFWKKDCLNINGYDEFFEGWGGEDIDFASRMINSGVKRLYLKFSGIVYHLWHNDLYMQNKEKNFTYYYDKRDKKAVRCEKGVDQYLSGTF